MPGEQQEVVTAQTVLTESVNSLDLHLLEGGHSIAEGEVSN